MRPPRWPRAPRAEGRSAARVDKLELAEAQAELVRAAAQLKLIQKLRKTPGVSQGPQGGVGGSRGPAGHAAMPRAVLDSRA